MKKPAKESCTEGINNETDGNGEDSCTGNIKKDMALIEKS